MTQSTAFIYTMTRAGQVGAWSRYVYPFPIDAFTQKGDNLYIRAGNDVLMVDESVVTDFAGDDREQDFEGVIQWPWLDFGQPGRNKKLLGFDLAGTGTASVQIGYNQASPEVFTTGFDVPADTVPGNIVPLPVMAPSMSLKLTYAGGERWQLQAANLYLQDQRPTS